MARPQVDPLRPLTNEGRQWLVRPSRASPEPAAHVARATALLAVADGASYTDAARAAGRRSGNGGAHLVPRFNRAAAARAAPCSREAGTCRSARTARGRDTSSRRRCRAR
jgi:hypothetical protein